MRQHFKYPFLLAALATALTFSCQKDFQPDPKNNLFENGGGAL